MDKYTRPGEGWIVTDPDLAKRLEAHRKERKARRRRRAAFKAAALTAAFLAGAALGYYIRTPAQADNPPAATQPPAPTDTAAEPTASDLWSDDRSRIDTPILDIDLEPETQWAIFEACNQDRSLFCTVIAIAAVESHYTPDLIGDDGQSVGMMQINAKWHTDRMEALGVTDLTDPAQSATVAADYLKELTEVYGFPWESHELLMAYNMGPAGARKAIANGRTYTDYSEAVLEIYWSRMEEMEWAR